MSCREMQWRTCVLLPAADPQCRRADDYVLEGKAPYMVQRSAFLTADAVYDVRCPVERELIWQYYDGRGEEAVLVEIVFIAKWAWFGW